MTVSEQSLSNSALGAAHSRRLVLFVGGFDPRGARHYHQLMRREMAKQAQVSGSSYSLSGRTAWKQGQPHGLTHSNWSVAGLDGVCSDYVFVDWTPEIRAYWPVRTWRVAIQALHTYWLVLLERQKLAPLHHATPYVLWTLAYPLLYMVISIVLAACVLFAGWDHHQAWLSVGNTLAVAAGVAVIAAAYKLDVWLHVSWLLRILNFSKFAQDSYQNGLSEKMVKTAQAAAAQTKNQKYSEVLVVGFSVGSTIAVHLVHALRQSFASLGMQNQSVHMLTLGNCVPLFTLMPPEHLHLKKELLTISQDPKVFWVDISSPGDSVSFGMCDLLSLSLPDLTEVNKASCMNPRYMISPRFHKLFSSKKYRLLRRNKMRMHFQYLMSSEVDGAYNYFSIITQRGSLIDYIRENFKR